MNPSHFNHDSLGGPLLSNQQHRLPLLHDGLHQEVRPHVVHVWNQDGGVVWDVVCGVCVLWDLQGAVKSCKGQNRNIPSCLQQTRFQMKHVGQLEVQHEET